jgi:hypothetical protein
MVILHFGTNFNAKGKVKPPMSTHRATMKRMEMEVDWTTNTLSSHTYLSHGRSLCCSN